MSEDPEFVWSATGKVEKRASSKWRLGMRAALLDDAVTDDAMDDAAVHAAAAPKPLAGFSVKRVRKVEKKDDSMQLSGIHAGSGGGGGLDDGGDDDAASSSAGGKRRPGSSSSRASSAHFAPTLARRPSIIRLPAGMVALLPSLVSGELRDEPCVLDAQSRYGLDDDEYEPDEKDPAIEIVEDPYLEKECVELVNDAYLTFSAASTSRYATIHVRHMLKWMWVEAVVFDDARRMRTIRASNRRQLTATVSGDDEVLTVPLIVDEGWQVIRLDFRQLVRAAFGTGYLSCARLSFGGACSVRAIFFEDKIHADAELPELVRVLPPKCNFDDELVERAQASGLIAKPVRAVSRKGRRSASRESAGASGF